MVLLHKAHDRREFPSAGEEREFTSRYKTVNLQDAAGKKIYIFCDDSADGAKDGGLTSRGKVLGSDRVSEGWLIRVQFDGFPVRVPLLNHQLDVFKRHAKNDVTRHPILTDIAEVRRKTTNAPVHEVPDDCGVWLDIYHFESQS